jgi:5-methylcytosine-specific restriction endonuclease McrA
MRFPDIRRYLKPYSIVASRTTTVNHAFAASIAPSDTYEAAKVREAVVALGQDADADLVCVYCGAEAETWDHVHATVKDKAFSGHGHRLGNLLPCCKPCNSKKGNKD